MATPSPFAGAVSDIAQRFTGAILQPTDTEYEDARKVHNGLIDKRPALIARCRSAADVVDAVARTARAQGGVTWAELNRDTQLHGLAVTGGVIGTTGIAGLTLGGGMGYLLGKHGFAADNLISAQIVTADGRVLTASDRENADLFWAVRGGGGNFGVATSFEYRLHPVGPMVTGGMIAHPYPQARDLLRFFRDTGARCSDELTMFAGLVHAPDAPDVKLAAMLGCHCGPPAEGEAALRPIKAFGTPAMDALGPISYCQVNGMLDAGYPKGLLNYWKSNFLTALTDEAIDTMVDCYARCPSPITQLIIEHVHGAATRIDPTATAFPLRTPGYNLLLLCQWATPSESDACIRWVRETFAAMRPFIAELRYVNYLDNDEGDDPAAAAYGVNYRRLQSLKAKYDPDNLFHMNQNIRPRP